MIKMSADRMLQSTPLSQKSGDGTLEAEQVVGVDWQSDNLHDSAHVWRRGGLSVQCGLVSLMPETCSGALEFEMSTIGYVG